MDEQIKLMLTMETGVEITVDATLTGAFAVHNAVLESGEETTDYTLTHVPSGCAVVQGLWTFWDAFALARELNGMRVLWGEVSEKITDDNFAQYMTKSQKQKVKRLVRQYQKKSYWGIRN